MKFEQNMAYKIIVMPPVKRSLDMYVNYVVEKLTDEEKLSNCIGKNKAITEKTREKEKAFAGSMINGSHRTMRMLSQLNDNLGVYKFYE